MANIEKDKDVTSFNFPSWETVPEETKNTPRYCIDVAKAVHHKWTKDKTAIGSTWGSFFKELRSYGVGKQSADKYKTFLTASTANSDLLGYTNLNTRDATRKGWWQLMPDSIVSFIPNLKSQIRGYLSEIDYDLSANTIDIDSGATEERKMLELYIGTHPVAGKLINDLKQSAGIPIEVPDFIPEDLQELEDLKQEGGFKEPYVQQHEKLLGHTEAVSDWDRHLKDEFISDLVDLGYIAGYVDFDDETCLPKWHYVDPENVAMQYDHDNGFKNSDYAQIREKWTISKLKQYKDHIYHADGSQITEESFRQLARQFCSFDGNPDENEWSKFDKTTDTGYGYDNFYIRVDKTWWKDVEYIKRIKYNNRYGKLRMYDYVDPIEGEYEVKPGKNSFKYPKKLDGNYVLNVDPMEGTRVAESHKRPDGFDVDAKGPGRIKYKAFYKIGKGETLHKVRVRKLYYCWWIEATDYCIKFGAVPNQPRYQYTEPLLPVVMYRYPDKSITFRCVPIEDIYNIAFFRFQNALAKAMQGVYTLNTTLLDAGGKKLDPLKVLKMMRENQFLPYKLGMTNIGGTPVPLDYIPGNLQEALSNEAMVMDRCMKWLEDQTGFSLLALGATPSPDQPVGTTQQSLQQTQKSLLPLITALRYMKEELGKRTSALYQLAIQNDEKARAEAAKVIGEDGVFILQQAKSLGVQYGISLVARPDAKFKEAVLMAATKAAQANKISADEELFIIEQIFHGQNPKEVRQKLRKMIQKNRKMEEEYKQQAIMLQSQQIKEQAQVQAESSERIKAAEVKADAQKITIQGQTDILTRTHDSQMKREEMKVEAGLEQGRNTVQKP